MRTIHLILVVLLVIAGLLLWIAMLPEPLLATGGPHPDIPGMRIGGDALTQVGPVAWPAYALQAAVLLLVILLIASGVNRQHRKTRFLLPLLLVAVAYQWVWWKIWHGYRQFLQTGQTDYFFGFTTPTSWMLYGIWLTGLGLLLIYVLGFRKFVFSHEDEARYEALLNELSSNENRQDKN